MNYRRLFIENSIVFLTLVTNNRIPILVENVSAIRNSITEVKHYYDFELIAYIILYDHIHLLLKPDNIHNYPKIIRAIKYNVGIAIPTYKNIWQNRFYEHTIRDQEDLNKHLDYIHYNSFKHLNTPPKDWEYSSFKNFVQNGFYEHNWCNIDDKNNIINLNYE